MLLAGILRLVASMLLKVATARGAWVLGVPAVAMYLIGVMLLIRLFATGRSWRSTT
jgi:hypothetical protein